MSTSNATGNQLSRNSLAAAGAKKYAKQLPPVAAELGATLATDTANHNALNAKQEGLKAELAAVTIALKAGLKAAGVKRAKIVRLAEATFGPNAPEIKEFRPATEGKVKASKA